MIFARTETEWWTNHIWPIAKAVMFIAGRINFYLPDGTRSAYNAGAPSALIAYSDNDVDHLWASGIAGTIVEVKRSALKSVVACNLRPPLSSSPPSVSPSSE